MASIEKPPPTAHSARLEAVHSPPSQRPQYNRMVLESNNVPAGYNILAAASLWILLAGYIVLPGSFTSLQNSKSLSDSETGKVVQHAIQNVPLLVVAGICCLFGAVGICYLWYIWWRSYVWLVNKLFLWVLQKLLKIFKADNSEGLVSSTRSSD